MLTTNNHETEEGRFDSSPPHVPSYRSSISSARDAASPPPNAGIADHDAQNVGPEPTGAPAGHTVENATTNNHTATYPSASGPELINFTGEPPTPTGMMLEAMMNAADRLALTVAIPTRPRGAEQANEDPGPSPPVSMTAAARTDVVSAIKGRKGPKTTSVEQVDVRVGLPTLAPSLTPCLKPPNELTPPIPFNSAEFDEQTNEGTTDQATRYGEENSIRPRSDDTMERGGEFNINRGEDEETPSSNIDDDDDHDNGPVNVGNFQENIVDPDSASNTNIDRDSTIRVPVAWPVVDGEDWDVEEEENEVFIATLALPWWKQTRTRLLVLFVIVVVTAAAVAVGVFLSSNQPVYPAVPPISHAPSTSIAPSSFPSSDPTTASSNAPSTTPSLSLSPSFSPTECVNKISANAQKVDLVVDFPSGPDVAVDGANMAIVLGDEMSNIAATTIFYSLIDDEWVVQNSFQEKYEYYGSLVALSGKTAFVGLNTYPDDDATFEDATIVYEQNEFGVWEKMENHFVHDIASSHFSIGGTLEIDGDLACISGTLGSDGWNALFYMYLFRRDDNKWVQFDRITVGVVSYLGQKSECSISGDTLAMKIYDSDSNAYVLQLYKYDEDLDRIVSLQDPIHTEWVKSIALGHDYLIYWDTDNWKDYVFVYYRDETTQAFTLHEQLNVSQDIFWYNTNRLALDKDSLAIKGVNHTHIYSEQNGHWVETLTIDQSDFIFRISGRNLLSATLTPGEVSSFNIEGCVQDMPTQAPTLSTAPTTCYSIDIAIVFDESPEDMYWDIHRIGKNGNVFVTSSLYEWNATSYAPSYKKSLCLPEGDYKFTMYDIWFNGICCGCGGKGQYNVTSNGVLLVQQGGGEVKGDVRGEESTRFSLPYVPAPSPTPSLSQRPSLRPSSHSSLSPSTTRTPSTFPSLSFSPTETCFFIEIDVFSDDYPGDMLLTISKNFAINGTQGSNLVYSTSSMELHVDGKLYSATGIIDSALEIPATTGVLCDCGAGTSQCQCEDKVCLIERGDNSFYDKVVNCEVGKGVAAIIYDNAEGTISSGWNFGRGKFTSIPAAFISQVDGNHLAEFGVGKVTEMTKSSLGFKPNALTSRSVCLPEGHYEFTIHVSRGNGLCCFHGWGHYSVTSNGSTISEGREFGFNVTTRFSVPFAQPP